MQTYVNTADFVYMKDKRGNIYGWGVAEYTTPVAMFGEDYISKAYSEEPERSFEIIKEHLLKTMKNADEKTITKLIK